MDEWIEHFSSTQQALGSAPSRATVADLLRDAIVWLFGEGTTVDLIAIHIAIHAGSEASGTLADAVDESPGTWRVTDLETLSPLEAQAHASRQPRVASSGEQIAIPLIMAEAVQGMILIRSQRPAEPHQVALAAALAHTATGRLQRLARPDSQLDFHQIVDNANVAIVVISLDGNLTYANHAAAQLYGFESPAAMRGQPVSAMYFGDDAQRVASQIVTRSATRSGWMGEVTHRRTDGMPIPVRLAVFGLRQADGRMTHYAAIVRSLGEQQRLVHSLGRQTRRLRAAAEVARAVVAKLDLDSLLRQVAAVARERLNFEVVAITLREGEYLTIRVVESAQGILRPREARLRIDESSLNGWAALHGQPALANDTAADPRYRELPGLPSAAAELVVPLQLGGRVIGTLAMQSGQRNAFQPEDIDTLQGIADQIAGAVDNAMLFAAERTQVRQLAALNAISQMLVANPRLDELWGGIYRQIAGLFNVSTFFVLRYEPDRSLLRFIYLVVEGEVIEPEPPYPFSGLSALVIRKGEPLLIDDIEAQQDALRNQDAEPLPIWGRRLARAWMGAPLRRRSGAIMGVISVQSNSPSIFTERDLQLLGTIATQVSLAMENADLLEDLSAANAQLQARARRIESLYRVGTLLSTSLDRGQILIRAAEQIAKLLQVDHCGIGLLNETGTLLHTVAEYPATEYSHLVLPVADDPIFAHIRQGQVFVSDDVENDPRLAALSDRLAARRIHAIMSVPLFVKDQWIGQIGLDKYSGPHKFSDEEIETCRALAVQVSLAVENADLYASALAANRLKSQFLATMSHELRTPLNAVMGYTEMMLVGMYGPLLDQQKERLQRVYANAVHLLALINDVLDLAKIESGRMTLTLEPLQMGKLVASAVSQVAPQAEQKQLSLTAHVPDDLPAVFGDGVRLRQVIVNLLSNGIKFTREGGVTVRASVLTVEDGRCEPPLPEGIRLEDGRWLAVSVEDTGIGIASEHFRIIFDAFRQIDGTVAREYQGTGLGLAITRQLVEMHSGRLWVESEQGRGSVFTFVLPIRSGMVAPAQGNIPAD